MKYFHENDLGVAAFLIVKGFRLTDLVNSGPKRYTFCFDDPDGSAAQTVMRYFQGESVSARELIGAEKILKSLLYEKKGIWNGNGTRTERNR